MYSVVLMAALTTGAQAPEFGKHGGCSSSCYSGCSTSSCYSGGYSSCYSGGHKSCHGGGLFKHKHGCHSSCYSSCYSGSCYSGGGWTTGCSGGACYGVVPMGPGGPGVGGPGPGGPGPDKTPGGDKPGKDKPKETSAPATIVINLPANAKLFVDGVATKSTSASRTLVTPELPAGQQFSYTLKAETVVNGQTVAQEQQVTVQGGQQTPVSFTFNTQGVASNK